MALVGHTILVVEDEPLIALAIAGGFAIAFETESVATRRRDTQ